LPPAAANEKRLILGKIAGKKTSEVAAEPGRAEVARRAARRGAPMKIGRKSHD